MDLFDHAQANTGEFLVRRGIPVSSDRGASRNHKWRRPEFPFTRMSIGDCFDCTPAQCGGAPLIVTQNIVSGAAATFAKNYPGPTKPRFATRQVQGEFVRCWRVE